MSYNSYIRPLQAVAQIFNLLYRRFATCTLPGNAGRLADYQSAIQQIENLRYAGNHGCGMQNAECQTQEARDVACGPHPAFRTPHFAPAERPTPDRASWVRERKKNARSGVVRSSAFTMIEIAISLAVIGFALVAIIGILPTGMNVQKENREETIIGQDAGVFMGAIRSGAKGMDELTNYVVAITNWQRAYDAKGKALGAKATAYGYTYTNSSTIQPFLLTNGFRIIGLLGTPKYVPGPTNQASVLMCSNYVVAYVRSLSGPASEKFPQTNDTVRELAFNYRVTSDVVPYASYDPDWTNYIPYLTSANTNDWQSRSNYWMVVKNTQENLHDLRLTFRWPLLANGNVGNGRQSFRALAGGHLQIVGDASDFTNPTNLFFFESRNYSRVP